jgi:hypothetical protein
MAVVLRDTGGRRGGRQGSDVGKILVVCYTPPRVCASVCVCVCVSAQVLCSVTLRCQELEAICDMGSSGTAQTREPMLRVLARKGSGGYPQVPPRRTLRSTSGAT